MAERVVMRLYAATGQRNKALLQYRQLYEILRQELGVEPDAVSRGLYEEISAKQTKNAPGATFVSSARFVSSSGPVQVRSSGSKHRRF